MSTHYSAPVDRLLRYGDCRNFKTWPNYPELGLTKDHIPELIRMATDEELAWADSDSLEVWAPTHAWRALGQLRAEEAIGPLMSLFHELDEDEWAGEELPEVYGMIGPKAISALAAYLADTSHSMFPRLRAAHSLERIGNQHPETRAECVGVLTRQLEQFAEDDPEFNAFLISYLVDLKAVESIATIRKAFEQECVDYTIQGDIEDVEIDLGLRKERATPANYPTLGDKFPPLKDLASALGRMFAAESEAQFPRLNQEPITKTEQKKKTKIGRNDPCPCGSGKKYKKCCLNKPRKDTVKKPFVPRSTQQITLPVPLEEEIIQLIAQDRMIEAIKRVREFTGAGLRDAKDYVDRLRLG
jgi:hypothetical protein